MNVLRQRSASDPNSESSSLAPYTSRPLEFVFRSDKYKPEIETDGACLQQCQQQKPSISRSINKYFISHTTVPPSSSSTEHPIAGAQAEVTLSQAVRAEIAFLEEATVFSEELEFTIQSVVAPLTVIECHLDKGLQRPLMSKKKMVYYILL
ncbi:hypothetical protein JEQ12_007226 [Ovis aries]|uniref:Uncharacterized protein n=1 Tax=Ovis aries TaxID=9940 RepID=A0A835ZPW7_SHEEP|nr:hypothetical protein JEQ12_007226 [Ovis aries]